MRNWTYLAAAAVAAIAAPQAASATALNFSNGVAFANSARTVTGTSFVDTYTFDTVGAQTFSGTFSTQRLRVPAGTGPVVSDLDFVSVVLDGIYFFDIPTAGTDIFEQARIASTNLAAGSHSLVVTYNISAADANNAAAYSGLLNLGATAGAVPEPATWAMMMAGFGIVGMGLRRRRTPAVVTA